MANKKITVVGDGAEQPLTPEEEHRLEARVDQMLDPNLPDTAAAEKAEPEPAGKIDTPELPAAPAPKVTKIVTKFADDDDEPAAKQPEKVEAPKPKAAPEVPELPVEKPKQATKKIVVKHHDDEEPAKPKKAGSKHAKTKAATKKSTKKLKVTIADGSEPEDLDSKADAITAAALAAEAQLAATKTAAEEPALEAAEPQIVEQQEAPPDLTETTEDSTDGAPPLIQKHMRAPIGVAEGETTETEPAPETPQPLVSKKIAVLHDETDAQTAAELPEVQDEAPADLAVSEPAKVTEISIDEPEETAETIDVAIEPEPETPPTEVTAKPEPKKAAQPEAPESKKYRPPEGPIQFKRAEVPIQPHKPGEPRKIEEPVAELSEDAAIAKAFESKPSGSGDALRNFTAGLIRVLKWTAVSAVVLGVIAVAALPSLRHKALSLIGKDTTAKVTTSQTTNTQNQSTAGEPVAQDIYLAKRSGIYNLYRNNSNGQQEQLVLAGTGNETSSIALAPNVAGTLAALVSTRDNKKDTAGELQQSLTLVDTATGAPTVIDTADHIKLVDWFGDRVVYVLLNTSTATTDTNRYQIISYNTKTKARTILEHVTYLNDVLSAKGSVYYATGTTSGGSGQFVSIQPDGTAKQVILTNEVAAITRTSYDQLVLSSVNKWYAYKLGEKQATLTNNVKQSASRLYVNSPDNKRAVYVDDAGAVMLLDVATSKETALQASGAAYPLRWLNNQVIAYRSGDADFLLKLDGTQPQKIVDVANVAGISLWHQQ